MKALIRFRFPLLAKVLSWLFLHLVILALAFFGFVSWQLGMGLDSLISGAAGDRLSAFGDAARERILYQPPTEWNAEIAPLARERKVAAAIFDPNDLTKLPFKIPANVLERILKSNPVHEGPPPRRRPPPARPGLEDFFGPDEPDRPSPRDGGWRPPEDPIRDGTETSVPPCRPLFLMRGNEGVGYWAGVHIVLPGPQQQQRHPAMLLIRADSLDGSGMFFDFKPWLWGGLAVLALSIAFWIPFVWGITRYVRRLTTAADRIAAGQFKVTLPPHGSDELGNLGQAIETMADRLDHLVSGQKRFLGDAAHELCAPLARLRTGLGILETRLPESEQSRLSQIESDAAELATLVEEVLAFSRAGNRAPRLEVILLEPIIREVVSREGGNSTPVIQIPVGCSVLVDEFLLTRAIGNLVRNSRIHAGLDAKVTIQAINLAETVELTVADNGPGVPPEELANLFEPFYRPDRSRSRDTGGTGLGLAIVQTAIETCGGKVSASLVPGGGFAVTLQLRKTFS